MLTETVVGVRGLVSVQITSSSYHRCKATDMKSPDEENYNHDGNKIMRKLKSYWMKTEIFRDLPSERKSVVAIKVGNSMGGSTVTGHNLMLKHLIDGRILQGNRYQIGGGMHSTNNSSNNSNEHSGTTDRTKRKKQQRILNSRSNHNNDDSNYDMYHHRQLQQTSSSSSVTNSPSPYHHHHHHSRQNRNSKEYILQKSSRSASTNQIHMLTTKMYAMKLREPERLCDESLYKILSGTDDAANFDIDHTTAYKTYENDLGRSQMEPICDPNSRISLFSERLEKEMVRIGYGHQAMHKNKS